MTMTAHYQKRLFDPTSHSGMTGSRRRFVIQLHDATHLHYDFRLEHGGVLKSWVVPKGPCLDANVNRLAKLVNDHAIGGFEGTIPAGVYGAGTIMLWDCGFWMTDQDVDEALHAGHLNFRLHGRKLKGSWTLTRWCPRSDPRQDKWKLTKILDAEARSLQEVDILTKQPKSVCSGRTLDEIACDPPSFVPAKSQTKRKQTSNPDQRFLFRDDLRSSLVVSFERLPESNH
jgi:bifunctional non-homologous end joining protein LigD